MLKLLAAVALSGAVTLPALAAPEPEDPKKQTSWGLYLTAREAYEMKQAEGDAVLFVDVREPVEIMFTGFTDVVDVNVPFLLVNPAKWNPGKPVLAMEPNPDFAAGILGALEARGQDTATPVILMCRSGGARGAPSAKALEGLGLEAVYVVTDGFEGSTSKDDPDSPGAPSTAGRTPTFPGATSWTARRSISALSTEGLCRAPLLREGARHKNFYKSQAASRRNGQAQQAHLFFRGVLAVERVTGPKHIAALRLESALSASLRHQAARCCAQHEWQLPGTRSRDQGRRPPAAVGRRLSAVAARCLRATELPNAGYLEGGNAPSRGYISPHNAE